VGQCKVTPLPNPKVPGYLITDPTGRPLRQFVSYDSKTYNIVSFYVDGVEAYREVVQPDPNVPNQYRWLGPNGSKWGLDRNRDGIIDEWVVISPEEVSQELLRAAASRDVKRLEPLLVQKEDLVAIGLPAAEVDALMARTAQAARRLIDTAEALKLTDKAKWVHVEFGVPNTRPADAFGTGKEDYIAYKSGTVMFEDGGKPNFLQTGELVQVGRKWKLVDGSAPGAAGSGGSDGPQIEPQIAALVTQLNELDKNAPNPPTPETSAAFNSKRADLLEQIVAKASAKEPWIRMLIDSHAAAAEGDKPGNKHVVRLQQWKNAIKNANGDPALAAYTAFRLILAEHNVALANIKDPNDLGPIQEKWRTGLEAFVNEFPKSADAPDAVLRLAMEWELTGGKDMAEMRANEAKARQWYDYLTKTYPDSKAYAAKATGALKRLDCEGKPLELSGPQLGTGQTVGVAQKDKVVVVYYWASWSQSLPADAKKLQELTKEYGPKGLVIVTVGLDSEAKFATDAVGRTGLPGTHLYAPGGLDASPLAAAYGIMAPPHVIVAGKDGKITNRNGHVAALEEEVKKLLAEK
jgi:hypothetical protein